MCGLGNISSTAALSARAKIRAPHARNGVGPTLAATTTNGAHDGAL